jgi:TonB family protein
LYAAAVCSAQAPAPPGARGFGGPVTPPHIVSKVEPEYSEEARKVRLEGTVMLRVVVGADGKARDFQVLHSVGMGLDENALAAVSEWLFKPGEKDGQPVNVYAQIQVNFRLGDKASPWRVARAEFHLPPGASRPVIEKAVAPHVADNANGATATLTFDIDGKGEPVNLKVEKASDQDWARDVTDALSKWKFTPASQDGQPFSAPCTMDFVRGN